LQNRSAIPELLSDLGRTEEALAEADLVAEPLEASGDIAWIDLRVLRVGLLCERGTPDQAGEVDELVDAARETGLPAFIAMALAAAARLLLAQGRPKQADTLVRELDELGAVPAWQLRSLVEIALALDDAALAERFVGYVEPTEPAFRHALTSARAQLKEAGGDHAAAAGLYEEAARAWEEFDTVPARAYALLGQGRCLQALGDLRAEQPLAEARELFASMGYQPALAEAEALLQQAQAAAS
jgi:tetratricopeptide (TPR) repeat protein